MVSAKEAEEVKALASKAKSGKDLGGLIRVEGLGLGFRVQGLGVEGLGFRVILA